MVGARILAAAAHLSLGEFFDLYPPKAYLVAWVPRVVLQLLFFALLAQFLGGHDYLRFVVIGAVAHSTYFASFGFTVASITWELGTGTVPLLVASPSSPLLVLVGRNLAMLGNGVISGGLTLGLAAVVLDLDLSVGQVLAASGILVLATASLYCFGLLLGSVVLRFPQYRNNVSNITVVALTFLTGTYVPVSALPSWIQPLSEILPVTHALRLLRHVTLGAPDPGIGAAIVTEVAIGTALFALAQLSFAYFLRQARAAGTLDFQ